MKKLHLWQALSLTFAVVIGIGLVIPATVLAKFPERPITMLVPQGTGGATDTIARITAKHLSKLWGVPVNVVNKPGGNTIIATLELHNSKPDGYTVMLDNSDGITLPYVTTNVPFNILDRTWMNMIAYQLTLLTVPANSPFTNFQDIVAAIKKDPSRMRFPTQGGGAMSDLVGRQIAKALGVDYKKINLIMGKSGAEILVLIAQGSVDVGISGIPPAQAFLDSKKIRAIAIGGTGGKRAEHMPSVPTFEELGYPTINFRWWAALSGPPALPQTMVDIWNETMKKLILEDTEFKADLAKLGLYPIWKNRQEMVELIKEQQEVYKQLFQ